MGVGFELLRQPLSQGSPLHGGPARDLVNLYVSSLLAPFEPAFYGREGDPKEICDLLSRDAAVGGRKDFKSEVLRVSVHGAILAQARYLRKPLKGYDFPRGRKALRKRGITPRIARRGIESSERLGRYRWVVERTLSWMNRYRRLKVRYERRDYIHQAFLELGSALICWRYVQRFC